MTRKAGLTQQFAGQARDVASHGQNGDSGQHAVHRRITRATPENFGQGDRAHGDASSPGTGGLQMSTSKRVARGQFGEPFAIEDQGPARGYSLSGHAARASAKDSSGTGPYPDTSNPESSDSRSSSSWRDTASVTY
jgi:hypothetical protein